MDDTGPFDTEREVIESLKDTLENFSKRHGSPDEWHVAYPDRDDKTTTLTFIAWYADVIDEDATVSPLATVE